MECDEVRPRLDAYLDGELPEAERAPLRDHLQDCPDCGPEAAALERLRDDIRRSAPVYRAPEALRSQIRFAIRREAAASTPAASLRAPGWLAYAASILLAVAVGSGGTFMLLGERQTDTMASEIIDSHLRSLLGDHLTDVASSDQHTVKPWFAGRTDLSPPTVELRSRRLSAGRRPARPDRRQAGPGARLQAPRACDQSFRAAGLAGRSWRDPDPPRL